MQLTRVDQRLAESVLLRIGVPGFLNEDDPAKGKVSFQFPPKILSDSRAGDWGGDSKGILGMEPFKIFTSAGERTFALSWSYIVDNKPGSQWRDARIKLEINRIRGYFSNLLADKVNQNSLIATFAYPRYTGGQPWTCRITNVDVKYSECLVVSAGGGAGVFNQIPVVHPLRTDITADMRLWVYPRWGKDEQAAGAENELDVSGLRLKGNPRFGDLWY